MKFLAGIKIPEHPQPDGQGGQRGDVVFFHRLNRPGGYGRKTWQNYLAVVVDLKVPCGTDFDTYDAVKKEFKSDCNTCAYNDPADCDIRKYLTPVWSTGSVNDQPTLLKK